MCLLNAFKYEIVSPGAVFYFGSYLQQRNKFVSIMVHDLS